METQKGMLLIRLLKFWGFDSSPPSFPAENTVNHYVDAYSLL